ncbi:MAG: tetratricopeptide repeat protein [Bacteroidia bacterium]|nr:tetratricopeptide repeat protein [Bacteroidia bacterium]
MPFNTQRYFLILLFFICISSAYAVKDKRIERLIALSQNTISRAPDSAIVYSDSLIRIAKENNDLESLATGLKNKGVASYFKGMYPQALASFQEAERIAEKEGFVELQLVLYNHYGTFYKKQNNLKAALEQFSKGLELAKKQKDTVAMAGAISDMGLVYQMQNDVFKAIDCFSTGLKYNQQLKNKLGESYSLNYLAEVYAGQKRFNEAIGFLNKALLLRQELSDTLAIAINYVNLGEVYSQMGRTTEALYNYQMCLENAKKVNYSDLLKHCYKMISEIYLKQGNFEKAYRYFEMHVAIKDSIFNEQNTRIIQETEAKYQTEKKQLQIDNLNKDNALKQEELERKELEAAQHRLQILFFTIGMILLLILLFFIWRGYKQKRIANEIISQQKEEVERQRDLIEEKSKEITDSIQYAKRIQQVLLASDKFLKKHLPEYFIFYKPKDIVSGDFYWANMIDGKFVFVTADCTGHGVPGAFMSLLNISFLNEAIVEKKLHEPDKILDFVRSQIIASLNPEDSENESRDGMDATLCVYDLKGMWLRFAAANNALWLYRNNEIKEFQSDKMPVGMHHGELLPFSSQTIGLRKGDIVYTFTDGYADQFGGSKGKKFKYKQLQQLLLANAQKPMTEQKAALEQALKEWQGNLEQVDDILIVGIKF